MISTHLRATTALVLIGTLAACSAGEPEGTAPTAGLDGADRMLAWTPEEVFAVGGFDAPEWAEFGSIDGLGFDDAGNLYVLDGQTQQITQISPEGEFLRTISQSGEGPGELSQPMTMTVSGDRIIIVDIGHRGFVAFDTNGEWIDNFTTDLSRDGLPIDNLQVHPSGDVIARSAIRMSFGGETADEEEEPEPEGQPIFRYALDNDRESDPFYYAWEAPEPTGDETEVSGATSDGGGIQLRMSQLQGFEPSIDFGVLPDGRVALVDSTDYRVKIIDVETGEVVRDIRRPIAPTPVDSRIEELERDRQMEIAGDGFGGRVITMGGGGGSMNFDQAQMAEQMRQRVENMVFYPEIQVIEDLSVDRDGRLWVQRSSGVPGEDGPTDLLSTAGEYLGTLPADGVRIPDAWGPQGMMAVIETDDLDIPTIRVMRIPTS